MVNSSPPVVVTDNSCWATDMVTEATVPASMSVRSWLKVGAGGAVESETTSRWATNTSRITIRIGKAALLRNLFTELLPAGDGPVSQRRVTSPA